MSLNSVSCVRSLSVSVLVTSVCMCMYAHIHIRLMMKYYTALIEKKVTCTREII